MGQQQSGGGSDTEVSYVVHVAPDPTGDATERDVKIYIMLADGSSTVLDGKWHRLPGYPEDLRSIIIPASRVRYLKDINSNQSIMVTYCTAFLHGKQRCHRKSGKMTRDFIFLVIIFSGLCIVCPVCHGYNLTGIICKETYELI